MNGQHTTPHVDKLTLRRARLLMISSAVSGGRG